jgi:hypothetical protein
MVMVNGCIVADGNYRSKGREKLFALRAHCRRAACAPSPRAHGRLLTLEDTVEFFNLVLELNLTAAEKNDLVAFLRML